MAVPLIACLGNFARVHQASGGPQTTVVPPGRSSGRRARQVDSFRCGNGSALPISMQWRSRAHSRWKLDALQQRLLQRADGRRIVLSVEQREPVFTIECPIGPTDGRVVLQIGNQALEPLPLAAGVRALDVIGAV